MGTAMNIVSNAMAETRAEDAPSDWEREPEDENELERIVEGEPVYGADSTLKDGQESIDHPILQKSLAAVCCEWNREVYCEPLSIIGLAHAEQSLERVIPRNHEPGEVHEQLATAGTRQ